MGKKKANNAVKILEPKCSKCGKKLSYGKYISARKKEIPILHCEKCKLYYCGKTEYNALKEIFKSKGKNLSSNVLTVKNGTFERYLAFFGKLPIENKQYNKNSKNTTEENKRKNKDSVVEIVKRKSAMDVSCHYFKNEMCMYWKIPCNKNSLHCVKKTYLSVEHESEEKRRQREKQLEEKLRQEQNELKKLPRIGVKDFVVRGNIFKCIHNHHTVENLDATVLVIDRKDKQRLVRISAGHCKKCNTYFIMESTFRRLKESYSHIVCRICDEKTYQKSYYMGEMQLAQESILMQYGYNVSETTGLSSTARQKILAVMIDNNILSKSGIISYLDFFIRQRSHMSNMETAISKWEEDEEFVEHYRIGEYTKFGVNAIYRR